MFFKILFNLELRKNRNYMTDKKNRKTEFMTFENLPEGYQVLSDKGGTVELSEDDKRNYAIVSINASETNMCHVLYVKEAYGKNAYYNLTKRLRDGKIEVLKEAEAEAATIARIYEENQQDSSQRASKEDSTAIAFFELILREAVDMNASDIHLSSRDGASFIKMRKHGELMKWRNNFKKEEIDAICSAAYNVLAENKQVSFDPNAYQPAAIPYKIGKEQIKLRYQSLPVYPDGYDVVLRVLPIGRDESFTPLDVLGYTEQQVRDLLEAASMPIGAMIIAGVTGSGKSTTLKNLLMFINDSTQYKKKIYTIEDPPEYKIPNVSQIPVIRKKDGNTEGSRSAFEAPITACMRADPDIIMIGEVRDAETGILTKKAVQSGHQVLTTVHAPSAVGIVERFVDFQVNRSILSSPDFLTALVYQKLLPTLCPHCKVRFSSLIKHEDAESQDLEMAQRLKNIGVHLDKYEIFVRSREGCEECTFMGINGRQVCAEIIKIDYEIMDKINKADSVGLMRAWRSRSDKRLDSTNMNGKTCMEHAIQKMLTGIISPYDVEESFKSLNNLKLNHSVGEEAKQEGSPPSGEDEFWK